MNRTLFTKAASVATLSLAMAATAGAQGFANTLNVVGQAQISSPGAGSGFPLFIDFLSGAAYPPSTTGIGVPGNVFAGNTTGAFTSITPGANGVIQDLTISPNGTSTTTNPAGMQATFMTIGGYTFTLGSAPAGSTFGPITLTDQNGSSTASFSTFGMVSGPGFSSPITYQGIFSAQFVGMNSTQVFNSINNGGTPIVTFSANFGAPVSTVPEPSTYALLATGVAAIGLVARRRRFNA